MAKLTVELSSLECLRTTEPRGDEVYVVVGAACSDGAVVHEVHPPASHWPMDDHATENGLRERELHEPLLEIELADGQTANATFVVLERDQGSLRDAETVANDVAAAVRDGKDLSETVADVYARFHELQLDNEDDVIGSFGIRAYNRGGKTRCEIKPGPNSEILAHWSEDAGPAFALRCHQQGDYQVFLRVQS